MIQHQGLQRLLGKRLLQPADAFDVPAPANVITLSHVILASAHASSLENLNSETQQRDLALSLEIIWYCILPQQRLKTSMIRVPMFQTQIA
jgi:hypothetical protein